AAGVCSRGEGIGAVADDAVAASPGRGSHDIRSDAGGDRGASAGRGEEATGGDAIPEPGSGSAAWGECGRARGVFPESVGRCGRADGAVWADGGERRRQGNWGGADAGG